MTVSFPQKKNSPEKQKINKQTKRGPYNQAKWFLPPTFDNLMMVNLGRYCFRRSKVDLGTKKFWLPD